MLIKKFEEVVEQFREEPPLKTNNKSLTYSILNSLANQVGHAILNEEKRFFLKLSGYGKIKRGKKEPKNERIRRAFY